MGVGVRYGAVMRKGSLTGPQMVTQSSRLSRKLLGSKGCQWVKLTRLPSDHSKFICSFKSLRPIHSSSTSEVQRGGGGVEEDPEISLAPATKEKDILCVSWKGKDWVYRFPLPSAQHGCQAAPYLA